MLGRGKENCDRRKRGLCRENGRRGGVGLERGEGVGVQFSGTLSEKTRGLRDFARGHHEETRVDQSVPATAVHEVAWVESLGGLLADDAEGVVRFAKVLLSPAEHTVGNRSSSPPGAGQRQCLAVAMRDRHRPNPPSAETRDGPPRTLGGDLRKRLLATTRHNVQLKVVPSTSAVANFCAVG